VIRRDITIINRLGLHARAAAKLVSTASRFGSSVRLERDGKGADAKSIMAVMMLAATRGTQVTLVADGADEAQAIEALEALIAARFGEDE
jgi:phosphocarrier protein